VSKIAPEDVPQDYSAGYHIGLSEKHPVDIGRFLCLHAEDPAIEVYSKYDRHLIPAQNLHQNFWSKLKSHLLPRIRAMLETERKTEYDETLTPRMEDTCADETLHFNGIHFKAGHMYQYNVMRINYTTYNVQRAQDTINPKTDQHNIMLLSGQNTESSRHQYDYACVLGIYHVNVIYTGPGMLDYRARQMEFLWVRRYENQDDLKVEDG
jgi:hypothetical protein